MVFVAIMLPVLVGFALLAIDMSRANNLYNDLQSGADALALAGAAELDGASDSIARAQRAIDNLIANGTRFSVAGPTTLTSSDVTIATLTDIPDSDATPLSAAGLGGDSVDYSTTDPTLARYLEVTVNPTAFAPIFPIALFGGTGGFNMQAQAVAGFGSAVCDYTPLFMCNPYGSLDALQEALDDSSKPMVILKKQGGGNNAQYGPGNYGFLTTPDDTRSNKDIAEMLAVIHPRACYSEDGVQTKPGNMPNLNDAINVRFDIYPNGGNVSGYSVTPALNPPAPNVRKGKDVKKTGGNCAYQDPPAAQASKYMALPNDTCIGTASCTSVDTLPDRLGDGVWPFDTYWNTNWPAGTNPNHTVATVRAACGDNPSRYCVYKYELDHSGELAPNAELTSPQCNTSSQSPDRRLLYVAVVDCVANEVSGGGGTYPVQVFASMFLTSPAGGPPDADIYAEFVDISSAYGEGTLSKFQRDQPQLYR